MARDSKIEISAVNIRIPEKFKRDYVSLISTIASLRRGVKVHGDNFVAINYFNEEKGLGIFSKYTEIYIDGEWFDVDSFDAADPETIENINIPENLKPNLSQFYFILRKEIHVIIFSSYSGSRSLSARSVEKYFRSALLWPEVVKNFGKVDVDLIKDYGAVDEILNLPDLKELRLIVRPPNSDDIGQNLADIIEKRLREQDADEYEEVLKSKNGDGIKPNDRTEKLARLAAENGEVRARSLINGIMVDHNTAATPLKDVETYKADQQELVVFNRLAEKMFRKIQEARARLNG